MTTNRVQINTRDIGKETKKKTKPYIHKLYFLANGHYLYSSQSYLQASLQQLIFSFFQRWHVLQYKLQLLSVFYDLAQEAGKKKKREFLPLGVTNNNKPESKLNGNKGHHVLGPQAACFC